MQDTHPDLTTFQVREAFLIVPEASPLHPRELTAARQGEEHVPHPEFAALCPHRPAMAPGLHAPVGCQVDL